MKHKNGSPAPGPHQQRPRRVSVDALMLMAKYDDGFRELLLSDRGRALGESGIRFSPAERMLLEGIGREQLERNIECFTIPGVTRKNLPDWRAAASVMVLVSSILFGFDACSHPQSAGLSESSIGQTEGWIDNDTFRVMSAGVFKKTITDMEERKKSSYHAALLNARYIMMEKFKGSFIEGCGGIMAYNPNSPKSLNNLKQVAWDGTLIADSERYDEEGNCSILYEVKKPGLKKYIQYGEWISQE